MSTRQKLQVMGIFWLGLFCCISSIIRFYYIYCDIHQSVASNTVNRYAVVTTAFTWGTIEPNASIISACLPLYGNLFGGSKKLGFYIRSLFSRLTSRNGSTRDQVRGDTPKRYSSVDGSGNSSHQRREWQKLDIRSHHVSDIELGHTLMDDQVPLARESQMQIVVSRSFIQESA
ncbi:hypothetical protein AbraIFM66950_009270 [Aspergillus brasiliensis]|nr:hypothetical protein AbraIFM66950_009270 [Aspergillus brasiliensis]